MVGVTAAVGAATIAASVIRLGEAPFEDLLVVLALGLGVVLRHPSAFHLEA
jgi:hypothetical protein